MSDQTTTISMVKGEKQALTEKNPGLTKIGLGLGWDINSGAGSQFDLDASAILLEGGKCTGPNRVVYFSHLSSDGVSHSGDNLTGDGDGDDEIISVDFTAVPSEVDEIVFVVNIYEAAHRGNQNFGQVKNAFIRVFDSATNTELMKYDLSEDYSAFNSMKMAKLYRHNGEWKFHALGEGCNGSLQDIVSSY